MINAFFYVRMMAALIVVLFFVSVLTPPLFAASVAVSPTCGPLIPGFNIQIYANGFKPTSIVYWKLIHSNGSKTDGPFGTFKTNGTGGFSQTTYIEDLPIFDKYTLLLFDDADNDGKINPGEATASTKISIPCRQ